MSLEEEPVLDAGLEVLPPGHIVPATFFARPSPEVARDLIGMLVWARGIGGGRLTEVEAYLPEGDPACHAARGRTRRNAAMFGPPGCIYLFVSYGVHLLLNFVCEREGVGSAVLIRAFDGLAQSSETGKRPRTCGPGRVGRTLRLHPGLNGLPLGEASGLFVIDDGARPEVAVTTRVGISQGQDLLLRYYMKNSTCVSRPLRAT